MGAAGAMLSDRRHSVRFDRGNDGGGTSEHQAPKQTRPTERGSISAMAPTVSSSEFDSCGSPWRLPLGAWLGR
jgi:hypothetical protein